MQQCASTRTRADIRTRRRFGRLIAIGMLAACLAGPAAAQTTTYQYQGNTFTSFSCGPFVDSTTGTVTGTASCSTPSPTNPYTSYTLSDVVSATLTFDTPLPANMALGSVTALPGFQLILNDGHQTISTPISAGQGLIATVATDASGNIVEWRLIINTGGALNGGVSTQRFTNMTTGTLVQSDIGTLACCDPTVSGDFGRRSGLAGAWTISGEPSEPDELVENLIDVVVDPDTGLTTGQVNSLSDKLNNALTSVDAAQYKQAVNQLKAFIAAVEIQVKNGKMNTAIGNMLIGAANDIIAALQGL
jgi:hypothetical protein